ncbi:MAG: chromosome segregation protein SMC, partial [Lachnospiraceae bacterium]|nr:chromosome segregation protein SMC [Lachnospiraceae bacterium]
MYLKSIEMHGFKSFANKIVLEFHNGITGIVGPNGSGKSNVADAVRWVLGEQSAKQLRGASMQDVIFAGTENRKALSYAYVAITMDNSDHMLPVDYEEVTIARRVYRSGDSEYLLNGTPCRLKDVTELFYDTGIGKEGYSIIGQGQIERILSGKPEERRELFDEAVGIVKFKKRKAASLKKLAEERENLVRVNDILSELERQVGPLEEQAKTAKLYLKRKEELKTFDVNMFLLEVERLNTSLDEITKKFELADKDLNDQREEDRRVKDEYAAIEEEIARLDQVIDELRTKESRSILQKGELENSIKLLEEQIKSAHNSEETIGKRREELGVERAAHESELKKYTEEKERLENLLGDVMKRVKQVEEYYHNLEKEITEANEGIERDNAELRGLLELRADIQSREQKCRTMTEQINLRRVEMNQRLLARKTEEDKFTSAVEECNKRYDEVCAQYARIEAEGAESMDKLTAARSKIEDLRGKLNEENAALQRETSRLESLRNIAERYDGYGNSIRRVMDQKKKNKGIHGVVADLIHVEKKYEVAIETALGGNIQNIVTEDEETAKEMITYLKENHAGRATFLPLTSVDGRGNFKKEEALSEHGVIGLADKLVKCDKKYLGIASYLLGRVIVVDVIDNAIALARNYHYSLHIVTLDGEYLSPGGSIAGGAFKNKSNLLGRQREIDDLEESIAKIQTKIDELKKSIEERETAAALLEEEISEKRKLLSDTAIEQNTAKLNLERAIEQKNDSEEAFRALSSESKDIEGQLAEIAKEQAKITEETDNSKKRQEELETEIEKLRESLDEKTYMETSAARNYSEAQIEESSARQNVSFVDENIERETRAIADVEERIKGLEGEVAASMEAARSKEGEIETIRETIKAAESSILEVKEELNSSIEKKNALNEQNKGFIEKKEKISDLISGLEKEIMRLESQREKMNESLDYQNRYMWEEYELTLHAAMELKSEEYNNRDDLRKLISATKEEIRRMGNVNVNAIDEYKEVSERYYFLKDQHDDLIEAEARLVEIIDELDRGMREQFETGFADIQREFD